MSAQQARIDHWNITLRPQSEVVLPWRADAENTTNLFEHDFATGFTRADALTNLCRKLRIDAQTTLRAFEL